MKFTYTGHHFPTGRVSVTEGHFDSEADFLRFINKWNILGGGLYMYTARDPIHSPKGHVAHDFKSQRILSQGERNPNDVYTAGGFWTPVTSPTESGK